MHAAGAAEATQALANEPAAGEAPKRGHEEGAAPEPTARVGAVADGGSKRKKAMPVRKREGSME